MLSKSKNRLNSINLSIGIIMALGFTFIAFEWQKSEVGITRDYEIYEVHNYVEEDIPVTYEKKQKTQLPLPQRLPNLEELIIMENVPEDLEEPLEIIDEFESPSISITNTEISFGETDEAPEEIPFAVVQNMPSFPGGEAALFSYLNKNVKYPMLAQEYGIKGTVMVKFVISKTGEILNVEVVRSVHPALDEEAMRVVKNMPRWIPGSQQGKKVAVYFHLPIKFILQ